MSYDRFAESATLTYRGEFPIDGDRLFVAIYHINVETYVDRIRSTQPWKGETLTTGDTVTIEPFERGKLLVCWDGKTPEDSLYGERAVEEG